MIHNNKNRKIEKIFKNGHIPGLSCFPAPVSGPLYLPQPPSSSAVHPESSSWTARKERKKTHLYTYKCKFKTKIYFINLVLNIYGEILFHFPPVWRVFFKEQIINSLTSSLYLSFSSLSCLSDFWLTSVRDSNWHLDSCS